jgi:hypothetical protein
MAGNERGGVSRAQPNVASAYSTTTDIAEPV